MAYNKLLESDSVHNLCYIINFMRYINIACYKKSSLHIPTYSFTCGGISRCCSKFGVK